MGRKIKTFAKILLIICILASLVSIFFGIKAMGENDFFMSALNAQRASGKVTQEILDKYQQTSNWIYLIALGICGIVASILGFLPIYWLGCLFERVESIEEMLRDICEAPSERRRRKGTYNTIV